MTTMRVSIFLTLLTTISASITGFNNYHIEIFNPSGFRTSTENDSNATIVQVEFLGNVLNPKLNRRFEISGNFTLDDNNCWVYENANDTRPGDAVIYTVRISEQTSSGIEITSRVHIFHVPSLPE